MLLPVWQTEFALSYGLLAVMRGLYSGAMAGLQIPVGRLAERIDGKILLALGTMVAALGYVLAGLSGSVVGLGLALLVSGAGSSTQHPLASAAVSRAYGKAARGPLGIYNFSGDLGKATLPPLIATLLVIMSWRHALLLVASAGLFVTLCLAILMPAIGKGFAQKSAVTTQSVQAGRGGFSWLLAIGILDSAVRMGFPHIASSHRTRLRAVLHRHDRIGRNRAGALRPARRRRWSDPGNDSDGSHSTCHMPARTSAGIASV